MSSPHYIQDGVPQGEMFSLSLFRIAISDITKCEDFPFSQHFLRTISSFNHQTLSEYTDYFKEHRISSLIGSLPRVFVSYPQESP